MGLFPSRTNELKEIRETNSHLLGIKSYRLAIPLNDDFRLRLTCPVRPFRQQEVCLNELTNR